MKYLLALLISGTLAVSGYSQTRNVLVNSNNAVVSPTNFWSVDASNARTGLGLGTAATNPASAFQPSSGVLSNLASSNAVNLTNLRATNIVGTIPASNISSLSLTNISGTLAISNGGTGATNAAEARTNLGATTIGNALFTATNSAAAIDAIGISTNFSDQVLSVSNISIASFPSGSSLGFVVPTSGRTLLVRGTNLTTAVPAFFGWDGFSQTAFSAAESRTNLGLNAWTTNTNSPVFVNTNGEVVSPTNFWQVAPINTALQNLTNIVANATNAATNARMLFLYSLAPTVTNVTSTITLPTNVSTFGGDVATITHLGPTSSVTAIRPLGAGTNIITLNQPEESVRLIYRDSGWTLMDNISYIEPIYFSGTNATANAAASRTNLGLGITNLVQFAYVESPYFFVGDGTNGIAFETPDVAAITRTNLGIGVGATNTVSFGKIRVPTGELTIEDPANDASIITFPTDTDPVVLGADYWDHASVRASLGLGATNNVTFSNVVASGTLTATSTVTAKTNLVVEGFVDYTAARTNNTPTNTPNFAAHAAWIEVKVGTNSFFLPAYQ